MIGLPDGAEAMSAVEVRDALAMTPIEGEGGWFAPGPRRPELSSIVALLSDEPDGFSALHRLDVHEGWQWLAGAAVGLLLLHPDGSGREVRLGAASSQAIVPAGSWQGAAPLGPWSLVACWCAPGFSDDCFTLGDRAGLVAAYPRWSHRIDELTRG